MITLLLTPGILPVTFMGFIFKLVLDALVPLHLWFLMDHLVAKKLDKELPLMTDINLHPQFIKYVGRSKERDFTDVIYRVITDTVILWLLFLPSVK